MAKTKTNPDRVAALHTHVGEMLVIRANPSEGEVLNFVAEHSRRYYSGEPGGPSGIPAFMIHKAEFYDSEADAWDESVTGTEIDLAGVLPTVAFPTT